MQEDARDEAEGRDIDCTSRGKRVHSEEDGDSGQYGIERGIFMKISSVELDHGQVFNKGARGTEIIHGGVSGPRAVLDDAQHNDEGPGRTEYDGQDPFPFPDDCGKIGSTISLSCKLPFHCISPVLVGSSIHFELMEMNGMRPIINRW
ncbi:hypothetical protein B6U90_04070 [Thermoplasmatales archaeon ex4484_6]|nr:MAG: hypothetical protein B6U90_04070 [Thermoplasmatales archaeon ex4484_6]